MIEQIFVADRAKIFTFYIVESICIVNGRMNVFETWRTA